MSDKQTDKQTTTDFAELTKTPIGQRANEAYNNLRMVLAGENYGVALAASCALTVAILTNAKEAVPTIFENNPALDNLAPTLAALTVVVIEMGQHLPADRFERKAN